MPRNRRIFSYSGYMHLILRGVGQQIIFENPSDYEFFLSILERFSEETDIHILAYCLMDNHAHLLVYDPEKNTSVMMKKLAVSYARHYNKKYERSGHLFQNRYHNENIEDERGLLAVFRYIMNNPAKAGICSAEFYRYSSYHLYDRKNTFVDTSILWKLLGDSAHMAAFVRADNNDVCMEGFRPFHTDSWAKAIISQTLGMESGTALRGLTKEDRDRALRTLKESGMSIRQIERLTGISKSVIQRA